MSPLLIKLVNLCLIAFALALQGSSGLTISPSPETQIPANNPSSEPQPSDGTIPSSPTSVPNAPPPLALAPALPPPVSQGNAPVVPPISLPVAQAPPPVDVQVQVPLVPPIASRSKDPIAPAPSRFISPTVQPVTPEASPPSDDQGSSSGPISKPISPVPIASPPAPAPESSPLVRPTLPGHAIAPSVSPPPTTKWKNKEVPVSAPTPANNGSSVAPSPFNSFPKSPVHVHHPPARSPSISPSKNFHAPNKTTDMAPGPSLPGSPPTSKPLGPTIPSSPLRKHKQNHYAPPPGLPRIPGSSVSPSRAPYSSPFAHVSPAPVPSKKASSGHTSKHFPVKPPSESPKVSVTPPLRAFPPPPPNEDCSNTVCTEPFTNTPPGSPCGCVLPIQVGLRLSVSLYTFFPLVSELALEISEGVFIKQSQVRIIGANAANQEPDKSVVLVDLVPLGERFDNTTAFLSYQRFWSKKITIQALYFGDYEVLYVRYPGLPQSPPSAIGINDYGPYPGTNSNARKIKPLGVDVPKRQRKNGLSGGIIAIIVVSSTLAVILCSVAAWIFVYKRRDEASQLKPTPHVLLRPSLSKQSGAHGPMLGSRNSSASLSFGSSIATYTGSAKTFSIGEIEKATDHFNEGKVLGEGGFGRVYSGVLEDGTEVAVKVLKRDDHQGGREFLAEVEMLSRLHHRNLVKLIGICIEERARCLVYELIPNGSVESHLHGIDKESAPLDWGARMKIALGAARGLAYLHEDSSPRVIHRDFKSSNILLEHDFTPKVSDFGLARTALDEENRHISTRVMGTFGYVAPEYAMTGHLLVKSDVYSYGVVLLELLTGRKPVDMSQPAGEENLVSWARPFLSGREGLAMIVDRSLGSDSDLPLDNVAKVAAIASMCVQPEVSNRPFMGEVVQALKLVCNEIEAAKELRSRVSSRDDLSIDGDESEESTDPQTQYSVHSYESDLDIERGISTSELFSSSARLGTEQSESFRRHSSSGPLGSRRSERFWGRVRRLSGGSVSEHGSAFRLWPGSR